MTKEELVFNVSVKGLTELNKDLNAITNKDYSKQIKKAQKEVATMIARVQEGGKISTTEIKGMEKSLMKIGVSLREIFNAETFKGSEKEVAKLVKSFNTINKELKENIAKLGGVKGALTKLKKSNKIALDESIQKTGLINKLVKGGLKKKEAVLTIDKYINGTSAERKAILITINEKTKETKKSLKDQLAVAFALNKTQKAATVNKQNLINKQQAVVDKKKEELVVSNRLLKNAKSTVTITAANSGANKAAVLSASAGSTLERARVTGKTSAVLSPDIPSSSAIDKVAKSLITYGVALRAVKKALSIATKTVNEMDKALTGMAVVTGMTRKETYGQITALKNIAKESSTTMTAIAELTTEYLRQGRTLADAKGLAETTAKAAKISGLSTADTISYMTAAINGFNLAASTAKHVSDVFANLSVKSATGYDDLAIALSKVSAQANAAGMSIEYTTALLAKGLETTQEAPESIGTALKTVLARMRQLSDYGSTLEEGISVNSVERALAAVGVVLRNSNGEFREMETIFDELGPKWKDLNTMQQQAIAQAVAGTRQQSRFLGIMQDWNRTLELVGEATDATGASDYQYSQYAQGMEAAVTNLQTSWQAFIEAFTSSDVLINAVNLLTTVMDSASDFFNRFNSFNDVFKKFITTLGIISGLYFGIKQVRLKIEQMNIQKLSTMAQIANGVEEERMAKLKLLDTQHLLNTEQEKELATLIEKKKTTSETLALEKTKIINDKKLIKQRLKYFKEQGEAGNKNSKFIVNAYKSNKIETKSNKANLSFIKAKEKIELSQVTSQQEKYAIALDTARTQKDGLAIAELGKGLTNEEIKQAVTLKNTKRQKFDLEAQSEQLKVESLAIDQVLKQNSDAELLNEESLTPIKGVNLLTDKEASMTKKATVATTAKQIALERTSGIVKGKNLIKEIASSMVAGAKGLINPTTMGQALVGLGITAAAGALVNIPTVYKAMTDSGKSENIGKIQNAAYEDKQSKASLDTNKDTYEALYYKNDKTQDEINEMKDLEDSIYDLNKDYNLQGKTGASLIGAMERQSDLLKRSIIANKNEAYQKALNMDSLDEVALSAIVAKMALIENNVVDSNNETMTASETNMLNNINESFVKGLDDMRNKMADDKFKELSAPTMGSTGTAAGTYFAAKVYSDNNIDEYINTFSNNMNEIVNTMADTSELSYTQQAATYESLVSGLDDYQKGILDAQYTTASWLSEQSASTLNLIDSVTNFDNVTAESIATIVDSVALLQQKGEEAASVTGNEGIIDKVLGRSEITDRLQKAGYTKEQIANKEVSLEAILAAMQAHNDSVWAAWRIDTSDIEAAIAESGSLSGTNLDEIKQIDDYNIGDTEDLLAKVLKSYNDALTNGKSKAEASAAAQKELEKNDGYKNTSKDISNSKDAANKAYNDYHEALGNGASASELARLRKIMNDTADDFSFKTDLFTEAFGEIEDAISGASNVLSETEFADKLTNLTSGAEKFQNITTKAQSGTALTQSDLDDLHNIAPELFEDPEFLERLRTGNATAKDITDIQTATNDYSNTATTSLENSISGLKTNLADEQAKLGAYGDGTNLGAAEQKEYDIILATIAGLKQKIGYQESSLATTLEMTGAEKKRESTTEKITAANRELAILQREAEKSDETSLKNLNAQLKIEEKLVDLAEKKYETQIDSAANSIGVNSADLRKALEEGGDTYTDFLNSLSENGRDMFDTLKDSLVESLDQVEGYQDTVLKLEDEVADTVLDNQDTVTELIKSMYKEQNEQLKKSLDERKSLYENYYNYLDTLKEDEDDDKAIERLKDKIAKLSTANDATSLSALNTAKEALANAQESKRDSDRSDRATAIGDVIDDQIDVASAAYDALIVNNQTLWDSFVALGSDAQLEMFKNYSDDFKNATEEAQTLALESWAAVMGNINGTTDITSTSNTAVSPNVDFTRRSVSTNTTKQNVSTVNVTAPITINGVDKDAVGVANAVQDAIIGVMEKYGINANANTLIT